MRNCGYRAADQRPNDGSPGKGHVGPGPQWMKAGESQISARVTQPVLVSNGSNDVMLSTEQSFSLYQNLSNAQLILYPDSGHGFLFQYPELVAEHIRIFSTVRLETRTPCSYVASCVGWQTCATKRDDFINVHVI